MRLVAAGALVAVLLAVGAGCAERGEPLVTGAQERGTVTRVIDGDTVDVAGVGRIRIVGIDTPERGRCGYESATAATSVLALERVVTLTPGAADDTDRYGRLLRYVDTADGDVGLRLIEDGWAIARYDSRDGYGRHDRESQYVAADAASPDRGCYEQDDIA
jgi:micrococcal nuclease